jgi:carboxylesterase type B
MGFADLDRQEREWGERAQRAQAAAAQAYERLIALAESQDSGQISTVARFLASTFDQAFRLNAFDLRSVDVAISDDMLLCLDALRWAKADLYKLVPDGHRRIVNVCDAWGIKWPESTGI